MDEIRIRSKGLLREMEEKEAFIRTWEGKTLTDLEASNLNHLMDVFERTAETLESRDSFDSKCVHQLQARFLSEEVKEFKKNCGFLIYNYLVIESYRNFILVTLMSLLQSTNLRRYIDCPP